MPTIELTGSEFEFGEAAGVSGDQRAHAAVARSDILQVPGGRQLHVGRCTLAGVKSKTVTTVASRPRLIPSESAAAEASSGTSATI